MPKPPRERAARALCNLDGHPPDIMFEGKPMWVSYIPNADAALRAALSEEAWAAMVDQSRGRDHA